MSHASSISLYIDILNPCASITLTLITPNDHSIYAQESAEPAPGEMLSQNGAEEVHEKIKSLVHTSRRSLARLQVNITCSPYKT